MRTYQFERRVTALSSISHNGGQSFGINSKLRREKFVQPDGSVEEIPTVSGNGIRGLLRDRGMMHMCRCLGYGVSEEKGSVSGLTLSAFYFLFSGGALTGTGGKAIDIDQARRLRDLIPLVGIFGGAVGNMILPGKLKCGKLIPICAETVHLLPERYMPDSVPSIWEYLQEEMYTRKDDQKNEHLRRVIAPRIRGLLDGARAAKASETANPSQEDTGGHQQMMYNVETFAAGTPFYWRLCLDDVTGVEYSAFLVCMTEFLRAPHIGGKSNIGMGEIKFDMPFDSADGPLVETREVAMPAGNSYAQHLAARGGEIRELLGAM